MFSCGHSEIFKNSFFTEHPRWLFLHFLQVIKHTFRKGVNLNEFLKKSPCCDVLIIFCSQHILENKKYKKSPRLFINLSSIVSFAKQLYQGVPHKAEN